MQKGKAKSSWPFFTKFSILLLSVFLLSILTLALFQQNFSSNNKTGTPTQENNNETIPSPYENYKSTQEDPNVKGVSTAPVGYVKLPVLMYHQIAAMPTTGSEYYKGLFVTPAMFEQQMKYLIANGYKTVTPLQYYNILKSGKTPKQKYVMLTFDDGSRGQYTYAYPILKKYNLTGVFYIISESSPIKHNELKEMSNHGMVIESHSATHPDLSKLSNKGDIKKQVDTSKKELEAVTGKTIYSIAYPGCVANSKVYDQVASSKYLLGFSCGRSIYNSYKYRFNLSRVHVFSNMTSFVKILSVGLY